MLVLRTGIARDMFSADVHRHSDRHNISEADRRYDQRNKTACRHKQNQKRKEG